MLGRIFPGLRLAPVIPLGVLCPGEANRVPLGLLLSRNLNVEMWAIKGEEKLLWMPNVLLSQRHLSPSAAALLSPYFSPLYFPCAGVAF